MLDWDDLRFMLAIHRRGSMQAAAEELGVDRATVIRRLDGLEAGLKARLFERRRDGCRITAAGEDILGTVEGIEQAMTALSHRVRGRDAVTAGSVVVTVPEFFAFKVLMPALPLLRRAHPNIAVRVATGHSFLNLARGEAEIALRNRIPEQQSLIARKVGTVGIGLYASRGYLDRHDDPGGSFGGHEFLLFDETLRGMPGYDFVERAAAAGSVALRSNEILPLLAAARAGAGIAYIPAIVAHGEDDLRLVPPGIIGRPDIYLITHRDLLDSARVRIVFDFIVELCRQMKDELAGPEAIPSPAVAG